MEKYNHFKERTPEETVQIIKDFFISKNCTIIETEQYISEIGTYSNRCDLLLNGNTILSANGKGMTKEYCLASCYGELYERFCAFKYIANNPLTYNKIQDSGEILTIDKILDDEVMASNLKYFIPNLNKKLVEKYYKLYSNDALYTKKYYLIGDHTKYKYYNPMITTILSGTNGIATGNSIEEALVQGSSELYERYVLDKLYNTKQNVFFYLNENLLPLELKKLLSGLKDFGYDIKIYDLSYNFKVPVCMILVVNKANHTIMKHFGSHPILYIAVERCITEIYQGITKLNEIPNKEFIPVSNLTCLDVENMDTGSFYEKESIPNEIFFNSKEINYINDVIYMTGNNYSNKELLNQIIKINNINNIEFYYLDISLTNNIYAVLIRPNKLYGLAEEEALIEIEKQSKLDINYYKKIETILDINIAIKNYLNNGLINIDNIIENINGSYEIINDMSALTCFDILDNTQCYTMDKTNDKNIIYKNFGLNFWNLPNSNNKLFNSIFIPWKLLYIYCIENNYELNQFNEILDNLGYPKINIQKIPNPKEYIKYELFIPLKEIYTSKQYNDFIQLFTLPN